MSLEIGLKTVLSKYTCQLKYIYTPFTLKWSITPRTLLYRCDTTCCDLCLNEKYIIAKAEPKKSF